MPTKTVEITTCQCQGCIFCHGGGCCDPPDFVIRFKKRNRGVEVAVCEMCGVCLLGAYPDEFERSERYPPPTIVGTSK